VIQTRPAFSRSPRRLRAVKTYMIHMMCPCVLGGLNNVKHL
jgi:hypothetical protein